MKVLRNNPANIVEEILVESGSCDLKTILVSPGLPGRNYGSSEEYIADKKIGNRYALALRVTSDIDTQHVLFLIDMERREVLPIKYHTVSTPACYWGNIELVDLIECEDNSVVIKYQISKTSYKEAVKFEERYKSSSEEVVEKRTVTKFTKLE